MTDAAIASRDLSLLAPNFRAAVEAAIADCATQGYPVKVAEALRSQERQAYLYAQGRTRPGAKVTNASTNLTSWHGYGLAVDVIHATLGYNPPGSAKWFRSVAAIFKAHGCSWGGDWSKPDMPHMQWGNMPASPQAFHKTLKTSNGNAAVWRAVGAADPDFHNAEFPKQPRQTLQIGSKGREVQQLQDTLHVVPPTDPGYGIYGPKTKAAVEAFQARAKIPVTGIADPHTLALLDVD